MRPGRMQIAENPIKKALDAAAIAALAFVSFSGVIIRGANPDVGREVGLRSFSLAPLAFGMNSSEWGFLHDRASILLLVLLLPNLVWGWRRLVWIVRRGERSGSFSRAAVGVISAVTLIAIMATGFHPDAGRPTELPVGTVPMLGEESDSRISELSLEQIEKSLNVPVDYMRSNLGLPRDVDVTEPLGSLLARNKIPVDSVRAVILMHRVAQTMPMPTALPSPTRVH